MTKSESLTPAQKIRHDELFAEATRVGTCTDRADRSSAEAAICLLYELIDEPTPRFVWCDSPASSYLVVATIRNHGFGESLETRLESRRGKIVRDSFGNLRPSLGGYSSGYWDILDHSVRETLSCSLDDSLRSSLWDRLSDMLQDCLSDSLWNNLASSLKGPLEDSLWNTLRTQLSDGLGEHLGDPFYGMHEMYWIAFYEFCAEIGVRYGNHWSNILMLWSEIARSACWWWPYDGIVVISERPTACKINDRGVLHCESGPALEFADGFSLWQLDGITVTEQIVMRPQSQSLEEIDREDNADVRSIRVQRYGWPRYLKESQATCLDSRKNAIEGTREALYSTRQGERRIIVTCPTGRVFAMGVPDYIETCEQAQRWLSPRAFRVLART